MSLFHGEDYRIVNAISQLVQVAVPEGPDPSFDELLYSELGAFLRRSEGDPDYTDEISFVDQAAINAAFREQIRRTGKGFLGSFPGDYDIRGVQRRRYLRKSAVERMAEGDGWRRPAPRRSGPDEHDGGMR